MKEEAIEQALCFDSPALSDYDGNASGRYAVSACGEQIVSPGTYQELKDSRWGSWRSGEALDRVGSIQDEDASEDGLDGENSEPEITYKSSPNNVSVILDGWKLGEADPSPNRVPVGIPVQNPAAASPFTSSNITHSQTPVYQPDDSQEWYTEEQREIDEDGEADLSNDGGVLSEADVNTGTAHTSDAEVLLDEDYTPENERNTKEEHLPNEEASLDGVFWEERNVGGQIQRVRVKRCADCHQMISLGLGTSIHSFIEHQGSRSCRNAAALITREEQSRRSQPKLTDFWQSAQQRQARSSAVAADSPITGGTIEEANTSDEANSWGEEVASVEDLEEQVEGETDGAAPTVSGNKNAIPGTTPQCSGIPISFTNSIYCDYPFHLHHYEDMRYFISKVENKGQDFWIQSHKCLRFPQLGDTACTMCKHLDISNALDRIQKRSIGTIDPHVNYRYRTFPQMAKALQEKTRTLNKLKLEVRIFPLSTSQLSKITVLGSQSIKEAWNTDWTGH